MNLLITLGIGLFIIIGTLLALFTKNNKNIINFSICIAFGVLLTLGLFEILPESYDILTFSMRFPFNFITLIIGCVVGFSLLRLLDYFVPHHEHDHKKDKDHNLNIYHVGIITSVALVLHNIIEGITLYNTLKLHFDAGIMMAIGIGLHNIPLGMMIAFSFYKRTKNVTKTLLISLFISLSTFIGGLLGYLFLVHETVEGTLLAVTLGMIIYITLFELLQHIKEMKNKRLKIIGIAIGILILVISRLF